jgi:hypothetical protein
VIYKSNYIFFFGFHPIIREKKFPRSAAEHSGDHGKARRGKRPRQNIVLVLLIIVTGKALHIVHSTPSGAIRGGVGG